MVHLLNRTPLASIEFNDDSGKHIRLFCQSPRGDIVEVLYDQKGGWKGPSKYIVGRGKLNTGIAAICSPEGKHIRVYFLDEHSRIVERCYKGHSSGILGGLAGSITDSNPWVDGSLTGKYHAAPFSRLGAVCLDKGEQLRVYFQDKSLKLKELVYKESHGWKEGTHNLPTALAGTSIAAAHNHHREYRGHVWLYFQCPDLKLTEYLNNGKDDHWKEGSFKSNKTYPPTCGISVIMGCNPIKIIVVAVDENNMLVETRYDDGWKQSLDIRESTITESDVALISLAKEKKLLGVQGAGGDDDVATDGEKIDLRLYFQPVGANIGEMMSEDGVHWKLTHENVF